MWSRDSTCRRWRGVRLHRGRPGPAARAWATASVEALVSAMASLPPAPASAVPPARLGRLATSKPPQRVQRQRRLQRQGHERVRRTQERAQRVPDVARHGGYCKPTCLGRGNACVTDKATAQPARTTATDRASSAWRRAAAKARARSRARAVQATERSGPTACARTCCPAKLRPKDQLRPSGTPHGADGTFGIGVRAQFRPPNAACSATSLQ